MVKTTADFSHFEALDIRVGRIVKVEDAQTKKPTYRMTIDFGPDIGTKIPAAPIGIIRWMRFWASRCWRS